VTTAGLFTPALMITLIGAAQQPGSDAAGYPEVQFGAQTYKDPHSGIIFYLDSGARHISAISLAGKLLWTRDHALNPYPIILGGIITDLMTTSRYPSKTTSRNAVGLKR
jgi:hypothetical protein